ncbi:MULTISPECIES: dihydrolipoamide acetyltransferase family protein [Prauserella salsuginis group]|uniref:Dihydrolipoamide acetyltransferase component of pyruvate dehydrogenase complex n=1 Tax=Prauserella salsuginis TaxID=387889 RepID=A0ABW6G5K6_9PSEU|nr:MULTISPECIES: dihydrolipoamide acetyltransferase family protein [Prauserella salsuginis group]MCR3719072.1 pyruvate dehydrogenase E2 component (dihydrolipoamide acetyltransferase) [Prauserella flava]MCR3733642.1 pyruvate dehydrogenase E2 component (dihydrolipoamide acetyltransferase) [Prauserella salsuginis]
MVNKQVPLVMPKMSMTMTEGVFVAWHKAEGDEIRQGEVVCEVTTDKVDMEVEATVDGVLARLVAAPEDVIAVGDPIAYVESEAEDLLDGLFDDPEPEPEPGASPSPDAEPAPEPEPGPEPGPESELEPEPAGAASGAQPSESATPPAATPPETVPPAANTAPAVAGVTPAAAGVNGAAGAAPPRPPAAVPAARRLAAERGVDLAALTPTGPWDTIRVADLPATEPRAGTKPPEAPASPAGSPTRRRDGRAAIARRMTASTDVPQFVLYRDVDLDEAQRRRDGVSWTVVFTRVLAAALRRHPELNATWTDGGVQPCDRLSVAIAVDTERGLLAPVLTDPDSGDLPTLARRIDDVVTRARTGRLELSELSATASSTMSNLGGSGVGGFQALLTPPQATALAVGTVEPRVVPVPGGIGTRLRCTLGLTVDHRVADGVAGARLLATIGDLLGGQLG